MTHLFSQYNSINPKCNYRIIKFVIILLILAFIVLSFPVLSFADEHRYIIYIRTNQTAYYHLGDDIQIIHKCNGTVINSGDTVTISGDTFSIVTTISEEDDHPDINYGTLSCTNNGLAQTGQLTITVRERSGRRYPNAYATWEVYYTIEPYNSSSTGRYNNGYSGQTLRSQSSGGFIWIIIIVVVLLSLGGTKRTNSKNTYHSQNTSNSVTTFNTPPPTITPRDNTVRCPYCGQPMVIRNGRYGLFYGCRNYPRCKGTRSIKRN